MAISFDVEAMVRGYYCYCDIWDAALGDQLQCERELDNPQDLFAVAVTKTGMGLAGRPFPSQPY